MSSIAARLKALEEQAGIGEQPPCRWIGIHDMTAPGQRHAQAVCEAQPIRIVWIDTDDHPAFVPPAECWCGEVHQTLF
jgi:hypothetical protein